MRDEDFERLYAEHARPLLGFLTYRTGDPQLSEDLLADTFERALRARRWPARGAAEEKNWLYTIALNRLRDHARRHSAERRALERVDATGPRASAEDSPVVAVEDRDQLNRAFAVLNADEREAIALRYGADLTVPEIAKLLRTRLTTVEGRVYKGLRKLRDELG